MNGEHPITYLSSQITWWWYAYVFKWYTMNGSHKFFTLVIGYFLLLPATMDLLNHYGDVIMGAIASQITILRLFTQPFIQTQMKENIKALRHWPLAGNSPGTGAFPAQMASNAENISIWWRHHVKQNDV